MANLIEGFDPSKLSMDIGSYAGSIATWASIFIWAVIVLMGIYMIIRYFQYKIPVELYEKRGGAPIIIGTKKARKVTKDHGEEYELLENLGGLFQKKLRKTFRVDDPSYVFATAKGIAFKLERVGETLQPIKISNPQISMERVPQNLLWWLSNKIVQIKEKYTDKKWWEPYIMPFSIIFVAIICLLMIILTLDKVSGIQQFCGAAERSLSQKLVQNIK